MTNYEMVREFHEKFGAELRDSPMMHISDARLKGLRLDLIEEEVAELDDALLANDLFETADALADILYVVYGTAASFGIPIDDVFKEVHRSNMSKLGADGKPIYRDDGKVLKGPDFFQPDIESILNGVKA